MLASFTALVQLHLYNKLYPQKIFLMSIKEYSIYGCVLNKHRRLTGVNNFIKQSAKATACLLLIGSK